LLRVVKLPPLSNCCLVDRASDQGKIGNVLGLHLREFRSLEGTAREKGALVERLPPSGTAILNIDDLHGGRQS
jgi:UDP-N-acetylmuramyl pentapeptide synthase